MAEQKDSLTDINEKSWLVKTPWLSAIIFLCTYGVFGWSLADKAQSWLIYAREKSESLNIFIEDEILLLFLRISVLIIIILISLSLTTPIALMTFVFEESLSSDLKAFIYILLWSILAVFILCSFDFFSDLLVIISANILLRLDLQKLKLKLWQIIGIIIGFGSLAYTFGALLFDYLHQQ